MVPPRSRDTTAWFVPLDDSNSRGRHPRSPQQAGSSFRTTSFTCRPGRLRPIAESVRTATRRVFAGGRATQGEDMPAVRPEEDCQLGARPATKSPRDAGEAARQRRAVSRPARD